MKTYRRLDKVFTRGEGCWLFASTGERYLDLVAGIATNQLGHCHPEIVAEIARQAGELLHVPGSCITVPQAQLVETLCQLAGMDRVFFSPCGTTAVETALKIAKKFGRTKGESPEIIAVTGSFHGRTLGSLSATMQAKFQDQFAPLVPGFVAIPRNDEAALAAAINERTAAVIVEPIQGESGVHPMSSSFLQTARDLTTQHRALLVFDEIQTGMGRTGTMFHFEQHGVKPDVLVLAKGLGSGVPIGACLAAGEAAEVLQVGDHGSTSGGNPLACAVALKVIEILKRDDVLSNVAARGEQFRDRLRGHPAVASIRGSGLMLGVELKEPIAKDVVERAFQRGLLLNATSDTTLRLVPPLNISEDLVDKAVALIADALVVHEG